MTAISSSIIPRKRIRSTFISIEVAMPTVDKMAAGFVQRSLVFPWKIMNNRSADQRQKPNEGVQGNFLKTFIRSVLRQIKAHYDIESHDNDRDCDERDIQMNPQFAWYLSCRYTL